jgi:hypothetical protein
MEDWKEQGLSTWRVNGETKNFDPPRGHFERSVQAVSDARTFPMHQRPKRTVTTANDQGLHFPDRDSECGSAFQTPANPTELLDHAGKVLLDYVHIGTIGFQPGPIRGCTFGIEEVCQT